MGAPTETKPSSVLQAWRSELRTRLRYPRLRFVPRQWRPLRYVLSIGGVGATLVLLAVAYLGYDLAIARLSPCETIFRETSVGLSTRISFLRTESELQIGREQLIELDERAQMTALNLKTCCTVLDAGRLDPEQFLQCKGSARTYQARLEDIADLVRQAVKEGITTGTVAAQAATHPDDPRIKSKIEGEIAAAKDISRDFNRVVVNVRRAQGLETLKATPPRHVTIRAQESEPNDDGLATNAIELGTWVTGAIQTPKDADYFTFTTPETHRDWIRIELQNRSATLEPRLELFDAEKTSLGEVHKTTRGADLAYAFVAEPARTYFARASNYYGQSVGVYLMRVAATKAYDAHEPNDDILSAKQINVGDAVAAGVMDRSDIDYFKFTSGDGEGAILARVENRSTTLQPEVAVYDDSKALMGSGHNTTAGGDTSFSFRVRPRTTYYVRVRDYYTGAAGNYSLTVSLSPPENG